MNCTVSYATNPSIFGEGLETGQHTRVMSSNPGGAKKWGADIEFVNIYLISVGPMLKSYVHLLFLLLLMNLIYSIVANLALCTCTIIAACWPCQSWHVWLYLAFESCFWDLLYKCCPAWQLYSSVIALSMNLLKIIIMKLNNASYEYYRWINWFQMSRYVCNCWLKYSSGSISLDKKLFFSILVYNSSSSDVLGKRWEWLAKSLSHYVKQNEHEFVHNFHLSTAKYFWLILLTLHA